ncbi:MAG TPA: hypothetical protein VIQ81_07010 [Gammaproteobacteria bacterium]
MGYKKTYCLIMPADVWFAMRAVLNRRYQSGTINVLFAISGIVAAAFFLIYDIGSE